MSIWDKIFGRKPPKPFYEWIAEAEKQRERNRNIHLQQMEDRKFELDARAVALDNYFQWKAMPDCIMGGVNYGKQGLIVSKPIRFGYTIHDEGTAKYRDTDFYSLVKIEFEKLKLNGDLK
jgi:hypothetical protein